MAPRKKPAKQAAGKKRAAKRAPARKAAPKVTPTVGFKDTRRKPETVRLRTAAVGLTVNDLQRSLRFYRDVVGFVVTDEWHADGRLQGVQLRAGAVEVFLDQDDWKKGRDRVKGEGIRVYGRTVQDIDRLAAGIKARGGVLSHEPKTEPWGERDFGLVDPDGFKLTISTGM
jgi:catechol 2,3-dioxygenase-like lactoylglutathione lyase family enzyme